MNLPEIHVCPACGQELGDGIRESVRTWSHCGFYGSILDLSRADYLANFRPLPDIQVAAHRIAIREPLEYFLHEFI